jgi:hypothetical protein
MKISHIKNLFITICLIATVTGCATSNQSTVSTYPASAVDSNGVFNLAVSIKFGDKVRTYHALLDSNSTDEAIASSFTEMPYISGFEVSTLDNVPPVALFSIIREGCSIKMSSADVAGLESKLMINAFVECNEITGVKEHKVHGFTYALPTTQSCKTTGIFILEGKGAEEVVLSNVVYSDKYISNCKVKAQFSRFYAIASVNSSAWRKL